MSWLDRIGLKTVGIAIAVWAVAALIGGPVFGGIAWIAVVIGLCCAFWLLVAELKRGRH